MIQEAYNNMGMNSPIAIFDSGIGSYSIVRALQQELPAEDIIYLADRASFPYGSKTHEELKAIVDKTISWFEERYLPKLIVVASNTPSIQVLDEVKGNHKTRVIGVYPPVEEAVSASKTRHIAILATKGAVTSPEMGDFIERKRFPSNVVINKIDASDLVALVESGIFHEDKEKTETTIKSVIGRLLERDRLVDVMTLSSTHLPFLYEYLTHLYPEILFLDPAKQVAEEVKNELHKIGSRRRGKGSIKVLATIDKDKKLSSEDLKNTLKTLGLNAEVEVVSI
jgi:glutamate racemase